MVHPVKTPLGVVRGATRMSLNAVRHPVQAAGDVLTVGRGLVGAVVTGHRHDPTAPDVERPTVEPVPSPADRKKHGDPLAEAPAPPEPEDVVATPVEDALDDAAPEHDAIVTEPSGVTGPGDDDEIPSPAVQPVDEDIEVITPVGTTGAGPAVNPDTTESDLQQPGTEPLMDPSTTKRIKRETDVLRKASDLKK